jgi:hypothetical protein
MITEREGEGTEKQRKAEYRIQQPGVRIKRQRTALKDFLFF